MHSRVYNLTNEEFNQDVLYDKLVSWNPGVDYVVLQSKEDIKDDIEWIGHCFDLECTETTINFTKEAAVKYWNTMFDRVKEIVNTEGVNFETRYSIVNALDDYSGMYVITEDGVYPLCEFFKHLVKGYTKPFVATVTQTFDYHF